MTTASETAGGGLRREAAVLGLVSAGHLLAHFYVIVLPPLFPLLHGELGVSYAALGLLMTVSNLATSATQIPVGFLVDRLGARVLLAVGLALMGGGYALGGLVGSYAALFVATVAIGLGNSVFHPADYALLAQHVERGRLGRAFSIHTAAGSIGWAVAPLLVGAATAWWGWQAALVAVGLPGLVVGAAVAASGRLLDPPAAPGAPAAAPGGALGASLGLLLQRPMLALFMFMMLSSMANGSLNNFSVSVLVGDGQVSLPEANSVLTAFFVASAVGILLGGVIADRVRRHETVIALGFVVGAAVLVALGAAKLPLPAVAAAFLVVGLALGVVRPARDMMVQRIAPAGSVGAVFGFVTVGINVGGALAPVLFGWLIDRGAPEWVFYGAALCMLLALPTGLSGRGRA